MNLMTIECDVGFARQGRGARKKATAEKAPPPVAGGRIPRVSRLMALAIRFDQLLRDGVVTDYAELARLGNVSRARITQIMNLRLLAPDIQEELLHLPASTCRSKFAVRKLQSITRRMDWNTQRQFWRITGRMQTST